MGETGNSETKQAPVWARDVIKWLWSANQYMKFIHRLCGIEIDDFNEAWALKAAIRGTLHSPMTDINETINALRTAYPDDPTIQEINPMTLPGKG
jgi:hypothetical protein